eukprot:391640_1
MDGLFDFSDFLLGVQCELRIIWAEEGLLDTFTVDLSEYGFARPNANDDQVKVTILKNVEYWCKKGMVKGIQNEILDVNGNQVILKNAAATLDDIDIIIFATGYDRDMPYKQMLSSDVLDRFYKPQIKTRRMLLYLLTFICGYENDNIAIVGGNTFNGAMGYEMQSRLIAAVWSGNIELPYNSLEEQERWVKDRMIDFDPYWFSAFVPIQCYMDALAEIVGVLPTRDDYHDGSKYIYDKLENGYFFPQQYRIKGIGTNDKIRDKAIQSLATFRPNVT